MAGRARRGRPQSDLRSSDDHTDGAERYMWAYVQGDGVVLSIPGLRDLELDADDARTIGEMLIERATEAVNNRVNPKLNEQATGPDS